MAAARASPLPAGQLIDNRFRLEELIGRGGTAAVYRARDEKNGRHLALKRALPGNDRQAERRRLLLEREYFTLAQLAHPRVIEVYDFGVDAGGAYYTMELLEGGDLAEAGAWPWRRACALLVDVASSLAILHSRGLLHRDISARNVRRGKDERAKLIDFGALSSIGVALDVVGTPPFVPPEALQMQVLDARADLYSLGALAYYLLAGRHAYPARRLGDLRDLWRSPPLPLKRFAPDAPAALHALVMRLLSLDRTARPATAAEVMRRLCALADLPMEEASEVSRAYLATPVLVGRQQLQLAAHKRMLRLTYGEGATFILEGAPGSGRTRALDACVLDGRLLGAHVARADGSLGADGDWAVARALCAQLFEALPEEAQASSRSLTPWLGSMLAELRGETTGDAPWPERNALIRGLREFVLALTDRERLLLAVDDVERIDEPSLALLAALAAHADRRALVIALTLGEDADARMRHDASLQFLCSHAERIHVAPLGAEQTEALLRSVFGETANLSLVSARVHALAQGNPRATMELAQHLVERGLARYEAGAWWLPAEISETDLPKTMASSLLARVDALPPDARELCDLTALADHAVLSSRDYEQLCASWEPARLFGALQELHTARVLLAHADHYAFTQRGFVPVLMSAMAPERMRELHGRFADVLNDHGEDVLARAEHLLRAGRAHEAIAALARLDLRMGQAPAALLMEALDAAEQQPLPELLLRELRLGLFMSSVFALHSEGFRRVAAQLVRALERESGLAAYRELTHEDPQARMQAALELTRERLQALPEMQRGFAPDEAMTRLMWLANGFAVVAIWTCDRALLESFPELSPLASQSPAIASTLHLLEVARLWIEGRLPQAMGICRGMLLQLEAASVRGPDAEQRDLVRNLCHQLLGMIDASLGIPEAEQHARALEDDRAFRMNAWRIRQLFQISQGDLVAARSCRRQADLLKLQEGFRPIAAVASDGFELMAHIGLGDLLGVQTSLAALEPLAAKHRGWLPLCWYGRAQYRALQGEWARALQLTEQGLLLVHPGTHFAFPFLAALRVTALTALRRAGEALEVGLDYRDQLERAELAGLPMLAPALASALSANGRHEEAFGQLEKAINACSHAAMSGVVLGNLFEQAAYLAVAANDQVRFEVTLAACALEYKKGHNPLLGTRLTRLVEAAQQQNLRMIQLLTLLDDVGFTAHLSEGGGVDPLHDRFAECVDRADRAHCALSLVLQQAERRTGYLYAATDDGLILLGGIPDDVPLVQVDAWIRGWFGGLPLRVGAADAPTETLESNTETERSTQSGAIVPLDLQPPRFVTGDGSEFEALPLMAADDPDRAVLGLFVLEVDQVRGRSRLMPTRSLLARIAEALRAHGDTPGCERDASVIF
jgi:tRNA A-37 threonylcarbamoyl transferase component Bud32